MADTLPLRTHTHAFHTTASRPMEEATFLALYDMLEARYPGRVRRVLEVCPVAVIKMIDNERDAQQTLANLKASAK